MVERIVVLLEVLSKVSDSLYILRYSNRSYFAQYTVILVTSRDSVEILLLYYCLRHSHTERELRTIFSSSQLSQKRSKISNCIFWNFSYKRKISFLFILCTRKRHSSVIENYIRRDDVIWCEFDCFNFHWNRLTFIFSVLRFVDRLSQKIVSKFADKLSQIAIAKCVCWECSYSIFKTTRNLTNLFLINDLIKFSIII